MNIKRSLVGTTAGVVALEALASGAAAAAEGAEGADAGSMGLQLQSGFGLAATSAVFLAIGAGSMVAAQRRRWNVIDLRERQDQQPQDQMAERVDS